MNKRLWNILLLGVCLLLIGCKGLNEPSQTVVLPVSICLPTNELQAPRRISARNAVGDPGTTEQFLLPNYLYFIVLKQNGANWTLWDTITRHVTDNDWQPKRYQGSLNTAGDSIYQFTHNFSLLFSNQQFNGRVYAIASAVELSFNRDIGTITSLDQLLELTFDASSVTVQRNLQHIYTTPYNYEVSGNYYGSFSSVTSRVPRVNLMLYHIASKVDLKWNVAEDKRINNADPSQAVRLTYMEVRRLFSGDAYCFKPLRNTVSTLPTDGYAIQDIITVGDEGLWWEGRTYFYTIPYTVRGYPNYYPMQMLLCTNDAAKADGYKLTLYQPFDTTQVFVPWLRGDFMFNNPLPNETVVKTVDN